MIEEYSPLWTRILQALLEDCDEGKSVDVLGASRDSEGGVAGKDIVSRTLPGDQRRR